jgi:hypothetical protein
MTRQNEKGKAGKAAARIADGLFKRGVVVGNRHADSARDAETGSRVRQAQAAETKGLYSNGVSIRNRARSAGRGRT